MGSFGWLRPWPVAPAVAPVTPSAALQRRRQLQEGRMPLAQAIPRQPLVVPVVAVGVMEPLAHTGRLGVGVDVAQRGQHPPRVAGINRRGEVAPLPEVAAAARDPWQVFPLLRLQQQMQVVGHEADPKGPAVAAQGDVKATAIEKLPCGAAH